MCFINKQGHVGTFFYKVKQTVSRSNGDSPIVVLKDEERFG